MNSLILAIAITGQCAGGYCHRPQVGAPVVQQYVSPTVQYEVLPPVEYVYPPAVQYYAPAYPVYIHRHVHRFNHFANPRMGHSFYYGGAFW